MRLNETKMSLEDYLQYYDEHPTGSCPLRRPHLNQIIEMHGFVKLYNETKSLILHCLSSIDLMPPARSTLEQSISPCAFLSAGEVATDLEALGWQEYCPVRSLLTLRSEAEQAYLAACAEHPRMDSSSSSARLLLARRPRRRRRRRFKATPATFVIAGRRPRTKRKRISINALTAALSSSADALVLLFPPLPSSPPPWTPPPPPPSPALPHGCFG